VLGALLLLRLVVHVLPVVEQATDGRHRVRGDLHEVEVALASKAEGFGEGNDPQALAAIVDEEDFAGANALVPPDFANYARTLVNSLDVMYVSTRGTIAKLSRRSQRRAGGGLETSRFEVRSSEGGGSRASPANGRLRTSDVALRGLPLEAGL
jgi:hypothetical protein